MQLKYAADLVKLVVTGGIMSAGGDPGMLYLSKEEIRAAAHCHGARGANISIEEGVDTIEHGTYLIKEPDVIDLMVKKRVYLVPTLAATVPPHENLEQLPDFYVKKSMEAQQFAVKSFRCAFEAGVRIALGTDAGFPGNRHGNNATELELMVGAGMSVMEAILAATKVSSECVGLEDQIGTLKAGKFADMIAVTEDPLSNIPVLKDVQFVMKEGKIYKEV